MDDAARCVPLPALKDDAWTLPDRRRSINLKASQDGTDEVGTIFRTRGGIGDQSWLMKFATSCSAGVMRGSQYNFGETAARCLSAGSV